MWLETLRIRPVIDRPRLNKMEKDLNKRYQGVAKNFGKGLSRAAKGSAFGIGLALLSQLMNPLEKVEEKIKKMLDETKGIVDDADRYETTPGTLMGLQAVGIQKGITPDRVNEILGAFVDSVREAREELAQVKAGLKEESDLSEKTINLRQYVDSKDLGKSFKTFTETVRAQEMQYDATPRDVFYTENLRKEQKEREAKGETLDPNERKRLIDEGLLREMTGRQWRDLIEKNVLGSVQYGNSREFLGSNFKGVEQIIGIPEDLNNKIMQTNDIASRNDLVNARHFIADYVDTANSITPKPNSIANQLGSKDRKEDFDTNRLIRESWQDLKNAENGIQVLTDIAQKGIIVVSQLAGHLGNLVQMGSDIIKKLHFVPSFMRPK